MKRTILAALLIFGTAIAAHADTDIYIDTTNQGRGVDLMHVDAQACSAQYGEPQNGTITSAIYRRCMLRRGWRFQQTQIDPHNQVCSARVLQIEDTDWELNHHPLARITLRIRPAVGAAYDTTVEKPVSWHHPPRRGQALRVRCDPSNPTDVHPAD